MTDRDEETYSIIRAAMTVHRSLRSGFLEAVYQEALEHEFQYLEIDFDREVDLKISYRGSIPSSYYRADFVCYGTVIVELKALKGLPDVEESQVLNYLKASGLHKALPLNFETSSLEHRRLVFNL